MNRIKPDNIQCLLLASLLVVIGTVAAVEVRGVKTDFGEKVLCLIEGKPIPAGSLSS